MQVEQHAQSWIFLTALNAMFSKNQWCGSKKSCADFVHDLLVHGFAWPLVGCFGLLLIALPYIIAARAKHALIAQQQRLRNQMCQQFYVAGMLQNQNTYNASLSGLCNGSYAPRIEFSASMDDPCSNYSNQVPGNCRLLSASKCDYSSDVKYMNLQPDSMIGSMMDCMMESGCTDSEYHENIHGNDLFFSSATSLPNVSSSFRKRLAQNEPRHI